MIFKLQGGGCETTLKRPAPRRKKHFKCFSLDLQGNQTSTQHQGRLQQLQRPIDVKSWTIVCKLKSYETTFEFATPTTK